MPKQLDYSKPAPRKSLLFRPLNWISVAGYVLVLWLAGMVVLQLDRLDTTNLPRPKIKIIVASVALDLVWLTLALTLIRIGWTRSERNTPPGPVDATEWD